jgi:hypothetical protein
MQKLMVTIVWNPSGFNLIGVFQVGANSTAAITEEKYSSHSQNGNVNKPVTQVEN